MSTQNHNGNFGVRERMGETIRNIVDDNLSNNNSCLIECLPDHVLAQLSCTGEQYEALIPLVITDVVLHYSRLMSVHGKPNTRIEAHVRFRRTIYISFVFKD